MLAECLTDLPLLRLARPRSTSGPSHLRSHCHISLTSVYIGGGDLQHRGLEWLWICGGEEKAAQVWKMWWSPLVGGSIQQYASGSATPIVGLITSGISLASQLPGRPPPSSVSKPGAGMALVHPRVKHSILSLMARHRPGISIPKQHVRVSPSLVHPRLMVSGTGVVCYQP